MVPCFDTHFFSAPFPWLLRRVLSTLRESWVRALRVIPLTYRTRPWLLLPRSSSPYRQTSSSKNNAFLDDYVNKAGWRNALLGRHITCVPVLQIFIMATRQCCSCCDKVRTISWRPSITQNGIVKRLSRFILALLVLDKVSQYLEYGVSL